MSVVILGSINIDLVVRVPHLPMSGETVIGDRFLTVSGGKGANVAVGLAKLGTPVQLVGQVGADSFGETLIASLQAVGINTDSIRVNPAIHSGIASIVVDRGGQNAIACAAGANALITEEEVQVFSTLSHQAKVAILELGIPLEMVIMAAQVARANHNIVILDPAPACSSLPEPLYKLVDIITPNEIEATQLVGFTVDSVTTARQAAFVLHEKGIPNVIITLGYRGALYSNPSTDYFIPAVKVKAIDSVAAGDAFNAAFAAALVADKSIVEAVHWGVVAGGLAAAKQGAQSSLPDQASFFNLLKQQDFFLKRS
ncbi:MAG: ribokinase [Cyanobacteria bacterium J083]|nr:MAG: ribokinase [Cyanobacteria bacterium J083]